MFFCSYVAPIIVAHRRAQHVGHVDIVIDIPRDVRTFQSLLLRFLEQAFHFAVQPVPHQLQRDVGVAVEPGRLPLGRQEAENLLYVGHVHTVSPDMQGARVCWKNIRIITQDPARYAKPSPAPVVNCIANTLTDEEKADGWKLLFDGKTSKGWQSAKNLGTFPDHGWAIEDGVLSVNKGDGGESTNGGDIITDRKYRNFILKADFKLTPGANSGILRTVARR